MNVPPMQPRRDVAAAEARERLAHRRYFRREVVLKCLPTLLRKPRLVPSGKNALEYLFELAQACVVLDERWFDADAAVEKKSP